MLYKHQASFVHETDPVQIQMEFYTLKNAKMGSANGNDWTVPFYIDTVNYKSRQSTMQSSKVEVVHETTKIKLL